MKTRILLLVLILGPAAYAQNFSETISKELTFEKKSPDNALMIANIFGNVKVVGHEGQKILLEVKRSIYAKTDARLEKGKQEVQLGIIDRADTIIVYVSDGCNQFRKRSNRSGQSNRHDRGWGYHSEWQNNCHVDYDYKMDFTLKVPASLHLLVSAINDGDVTVENINGIVKAGNINGSIRLTNLKSEADAHTINGDVDIEYAQNPGKDCRFYTLNGDINASFQPGLSANMSFESFNGSFYTNLNSLETLPVKVEKATKGDGIKYKINGNRYQIGRGGAMLDFETFNGNVYVKEKTN
ncbi:MAG: hypothetical protein WEB30_03370 [Cyclobacteriaceae bacterium]